MEGELELAYGRVEAQFVEGAPYPPVDPDRLSDHEPRSRLEVAETSQPVELKEPSRAAETARAGDPDPGGNPNPVTFHEYRPSDTLTKKLTNAADMSGADSERDAVLMSFNWSCDASADGGANWKRLNPTTIFPETLGDGFCCDQVVTYVPQVDRFVWFLQYDKDAGGQGAFRIAAASSQQVANDPTVWTFWDFVAGDFGDAASDMDYPDLAYSESFLYVATDMMNANGRLVVRIPLNELAAGGTINFQYTDPAQATTAFFGHLVQQTGSQAVWVGQRDNSTLEIFTMPDAGNTYSSFTAGVATWPNGTLSSTGPDGNDWLTKLESSMRFAVTGGVQRDNGNIALAWTASKGAGTAGGFDFPNTHARVVEVDMAAQSVVSEMQVWNPDYAFAYPALAVNAQGELGIILGWGGTNNHANCAMGIIGGFVVWFRDDSTRTVQRFGDYLTTRPAQRDRSLFNGFGYFVSEVAGDPNSCTYTPYYVRYGR